MVLTLPDLHHLQLFGTAFTRGDEVEEVEGGEGYDWEEEGEWYAGYEGGPPAPNPGPGQGQGGGKLWSEEEGARGGAPGASTQGKGAAAAVASGSSSGGSGLAQAPSGRCHSPGSPKDSPSAGGKGPGEKEGEGEVGQQHGQALGHPNAGGLRRRRRGPPGRRARFHPYCTARAR